MKKNRIIALSLLTLMTVSSAELVIANNSIELSSGVAKAESSAEEEVVLKIPDVELRKQLVDIIKSKRDSLPSNLEGTNPNETLYITDQSRLNEISKLSMWRTNIKSLEGLEYLNNLSDITFNYGDLSGSTVDLTGNKNLKLVTIRDCKINSINVNGLTNLEQLRLGGNELTEIDLSTNTALKELALDQNKFSSVDISNNILLEKIFFGNEEGQAEGNTIKSLDLSKNTSMKEIDVQNLGIESITGVPASIRGIYANNNNIKTIDLSNCTLLKNAVLNNNSLEALDLKNNKNLEWLYCSDNNLKSLDLSQNTKLVYSENINYISNQVSSASISEESGKWILDMSSLVGKENIKNISNISNGILDSDTGKIAFENKPEEITYDYITGSTYEGQPHIALGTMKNVKLTLKENEEVVPSPQEKITVWIQYRDPSKTPAIVKTEKKLVETDSEIELDIPDGYELVENQEIPKATKNNQVIKINVKSKSRVNKDDLKVQIDKAQELVDSEAFNKYTEASKHEVVQQLKMAKMVYEDSNSSQYSVDDQTNALIHFMGQLVEKPVDKQRVLSIPDENFRREIYFAIQRAVDPKPPLEDGEKPYDSFNLYTSDIELLADAEYIQIDDSSISDLKGLEYFKNIHALEITKAPELKKVDITKNTKLKSLDLSETGVKELNTGSIGIEVLKMEKNNIEKLDLSKNTSLKKAELNSGLIKELITGSINIEDLSVVGNKLTSLDLSKNKELKELYVGANNITELTLPETSKLININALDNNIKNMDLSKQSELSNIVIGNNEVKSLDISKNKKLTGLACYGNGMEEIIFGENLELKTLLCDDNNIETIDLSKLVNLENLDIKNNKISVLNLENNKNARDLYDKELISPQSIDLDLGEVEKDKNMEIKAEDIVGKDNVGNIISSEGAEYDSEKQIFTLKPNMTTMSYEYKTNSEKLPKMKVNVKLKYSLKEAKPDKPADMEIPVTPSNPIKPSDSNNDKDNKQDKEEIEEAKFKDIEGHWAKENILKAFAKGLFKGTSETEFSPDINMTRGMFVTVLGRLANEKSVPNDKFTDVNKDIYYAKYIAWAEENRIIKGYGNGKFGPDAKVTREEMATIIARFMDYKDIKLQSNAVEDFSDQAKVSEWAKGSVSKIQKSGLIEGKGSGVFDPKADSTRAEVATLMIRVMESYMQK